MLHHAVGLLDSQMLIRITLVIPDRRTARLEQHADMSTAPAELLDQGWRRSGKFLYKVSSRNNQPFTYCCIMQGRVCRTQQALLSGYHHRSWQKTCCWHALTCTLSEPAARQPEHLLSAVHHTLGRDRLPAHQGT
jgi:hypothetical protein